MQMATMNYPSLLPHLRTICPVHGMAFSTSSAMAKNSAGKYYSKRHALRKDEVLKLTYDMHQRPHKIGVHKSWLSWHTHQVNGFWQQPGLMIAQEQVIRRVIRATMFDFLPEFMGPQELVIKHRGNCVFVSGFLTWKPNNSVRLDKMYWLWGFTEELLTNLLKQPVKLELQYVRSPDDLVVSRVGT